MQNFFYSPSAAFPESHIAQQVSAAQVFILQHGGGGAGGGGGGSEGRSRCLQGGGSPRGVVIKPEWRMKSQNKFKDEVKNKMEVRQQLEASSDRGAEVERDWTPVHKWSPCDSWGLHPAPASSTDFNEQDTSNQQWWALRFPAVAVKIKELQQVLLENKNSLFHPDSFSRHIYELQLFKMATENFIRQNRGYLIYTSWADTLSWLLLTNFSF